MGALRHTVALQVEKGFEAPSIPLVLTRIIQILDEDIASSHELETLILHDPSLSARILRLANSAFYSFRQEVKTISHAISLLGLNLVRSLAIGVSIFDSFSRGLKQEALLINHLWMHSFATGQLVQQIWTRRTSRKEGEFGFLCGLLHDLGKVVYFKYDPQHYARLFSRENRPEDPDLSVLEEEAYGVNHAAMGARLAKQWGLPLGLSNVVRNHHAVLNPGEPLVAAVALADSLVREAKIGMDGDSGCGADLMKLQAMLNMSATEMANITSSIEVMRKSIEEFFRL